MVSVYIFQRFFTFVSYKYCLMVEKGEIVSNCPKQSKTGSKVMSSHRRSMVRVYWEYICWFQKCFRQVLFVQWTFDPIFCHRGYVQQYNTLMPQLFGIFLTSPSSFSFLAFLYFATLKASFTLSSLFLCFCFRWLYILHASSPGC